LKNFVRLCYGGAMSVNNGPSVGTLAGDSHHLPLRVYYEDTDFSGVVYHASYLRFFERGRTEFIRALGIDQQALFRQDGVAFAVRSLTVEFLKPAQMDDVLDVVTKVAALRGPTLRLEQSLRRGAELLTTAQVLVVCIGAGRLRRLPPALVAAVSASPGAQASPPIGAEIG
jgi:acyl-CoA thioester hydrolase